MKLINKFKSPNFDKRRNTLLPKLIIVHYTAMLSEFEAIDFLLNPLNKVSSHFFISKKGLIYNLVNVKNRAWHAGIAYWRNKQDINSSSIGIELDNSGPLLNNENFTIGQKNSLVELLIYLKKKYKIKNQSILGHSDISPYRKIDPGSKFPWLLLSKKNIGFYPKIIKKKESEKLKAYFVKLSIRHRRSMTLHMLEIIGYDTRPCLNNNNKFKLLVKSYQMHYNKNNITGKVDNKTFKIIKGHFNQILT